VCNLVTDPGGDSWLSGHQDTVAYPSLDIVSADVASDGVTLAAAIRVKQLTESDSNAPGGRQWLINFTNGNNSVGLFATKSSQGEYFGEGTGQFDYAHNEVRIRIPLSKLPNAKIVKGSVLRGFNVTTTLVVGLDPSLNFGYGPTVGSPEDQASATSSYVVGKASCLKVGP
jgi:hypothetical protein